MGAKAKKAMKKQLNKASAKLSVSTPKKEVAAAAAISTPTATAADFLPLEGGPAQKLPLEKPKDDVAKVLYIGRIPHGFYETEMQGFFGQFGAIKRLRIARNKKTGKSKHFGFIEFEDPEVAKIVAETMHNYLLFEHLLQVHLIPPQNVHPKLWKGYNRSKPLNWVQIERKRHDKERTLEEHKKLVEKIKKRDLKRQKRIEAAGIDYECPEIVGGSDQPSPKKRKSDQPAPKKRNSDQPAPKKMKSHQPAPKKMKRDQPAPKKMESDQPAPKKMKSDKPAPKKINDQPAPKKIKSDQPAPKNMKSNQPAPKKRKSDQRAPKKI